MTCACHGASGAVDAEEPVGRAVAGGEAAVAQEHRVGLVREALDVGRGQRQRRTFHAASREQAERCECSEDGVSERAGPRTRKIERAPSRG